ncbi:Hsp20 family protein [Spirosoma sp. KUDC1026]|nr:Hsp20 family protein [Spirosoma sp. KUDC1026]
MLTDGISASYADGILRVTLPKNPETNAPAQTINVA